MSDDVQSGQDLDGPSGAMAEFHDLTAEELVNRMLSEPEPPPLASFPLHTDEGRKEFLREYLRRGEPGLFQAAGYIWSFLNEPRSVRCTAMGLAAGTGGKGKSALTNILLAVLDEVMNIKAVLPKAAEFPSFDEWHQAVVDSVADEEIRTRAVLQRYSDILSGSAETTPTSSAELIQGPWPNCNEPSP